MNYRILLSMIFLCGLISCAGYQVEVQPDDEGCHIIHRMTLNNASADQRDLGMYGQIWIEGEVFKSIGTQPSYYAINVSCIVSPGLMIPSDSSFTISVDDFQTTYSGMSSRYLNKEVEMAGYPYLLEKCTYQVDKSVLKRIGESHSVHFTLKGKNRILNGTLSKTCINRFKSFFNEHVN